MPGSRRNSHGSSERRSNRSPGFKPRGKRPRPDEPPSAHGDEEPRWWEGLGPRRRMPRRSESQSRQGWPKGRRGYPGPGEGSPPLMHPESLYPPPHPRGLDEGPPTIDIPPPMDPALDYSSPDLMAVKGSMGFPAAPPSLGAYGLPPHLRPDQFPTATPPPRVGGPRSVPPGAGAPVFGEPGIHTGPPGRQPVPILPPHALLGMAPPYGAPLDFGGREAPANIMAPPQVMPPQALGGPHQGRRLQPVEMETPAPRTFSAQPRRGRAPPLQVDDGGRVVNVVQSTVLNVMAAVGLPSLQSDLMIAEASRPSIEEQELFAQLNRGRQQARERGSRINPHVVALVQAAVAPAAASGNVGTSNEIGPVPIVT